MKYFLSLVVFLSLPFVLPAQRNIKKQVLFASGKHALSREMKSRLDSLASQVQTQTDYSVMLAGNTDSIGSVEYNQSLSERRVDAVKKYLTAKGIDETKIKSANANGELKPLFSNTAEDSRSRNRRVDIVVVFPLPKKVPVVDSVVVEKKPCNDSLLTDASTGISIVVNCKDKNKLIDFSAEFIRDTKTLREKDMPTQTSDGRPLESRGVIRICGDNVPKDENGLVEVCVPITYISKADMKEIKVWELSKNPKTKRNGWKEVRVQVKPKMINGQQYLTYKAKPCTHINLDMLKASKNTIVKFRGMKLDSMTAVVDYPEQLAVMYPNRETQEKAEFIIFRQYNDSTAYLSAKVRVKSEMVDISSVSLSKLKYQSMRGRYIVRRRDLKKFGIAATAVASAETVR